MKNADPQDVVIVLGVYVLIISIIVFLHWAAVWADQMSEREAHAEYYKARCITLWLVARDGLFLEMLQRTGRKYRYGNRISAQ